ncbi:hypothetical protein C8R46DRAFT_1050060 [Mycena filopes]|nr:hypothetical protein C8R46DRAFT_1050060 [Mycena filopes]
MQMGEVHDGSSIVRCKMPKQEVELLIYTTEVKSEMEPRIAPVGLPETDKDNEVHTSKNWRVRGRQKRSEVILKMHIVVLNLKPGRVLAEEWTGTDRIIKEETAHHTLPAVLVHGLVDDAIRHPRRVTRRNGAVEQVIHDLRFQQVAVATVDNSGNGERQPLTFQLKELLCVVVVVGQRKIVAQPGHISARVEQVTVGVADGVQIERESKKNLAGITEAAFGDVCRREIDRKRLGRMKGREEGGAAGGI